MLKRAGQAILSRVADVQDPQEGAAAWAAFGCMFCLLGSHFVVAPLRDEAAIALGTDRLPQMFVASLFGVLVLTPLTTAYLSRATQPKGQLLQRFLAMLATIMLGFYVLYSTSTMHRDASQTVTTPLLSTSISAGSVLSMVPVTAATGAMPVTHEAARQLQRKLQEAFHMAAQHAYQPLSARALLQSDLVLLSDDQDSQPAVASLVHTGLTSNYPTTQDRRLTATQDRISATAKGIFRGDSGGKAVHQTEGTANMQKGSSDTTQGGEQRTKQKAHADHGLLQSGSTAAARHLASDNTARGVPSQPGSAAGAVAPSPAAAVQTQQPGSGDPGLDGFQRLVRATFYVWLNVQNLPAMSGVWTRCADVFSPEAAVRLFGFISAGATAGQLCGSLLTMQVAHVAVALTGDSGPAGNTASSATLNALILVASALMFASAWLVARISTGRSIGRIPTAGAPTLEGGSKPAVGAVPGGLTGGWRGSGKGWRMISWKATDSVRVIWASPYLSLLCANLLLTYIVGSLMYFQRTVVVAGAMQGTAQRAAFFATVYSASGACVGVLQLLATGWLLRTLGVTLALSIMPLFCAAAMAYVGLHSDINVVAGVEVMRKVMVYTLVRPAREMLFTVLTRDEKYRAKLTIDTVVQRAGDVLAAGLFQVLNVQLRMGMTGIVLAGVGACLLWGGTAVGLGRKYFWQKQLGSSG